MPATPPARPTTPTTKLATYADLYRMPKIVVWTPISTWPVAAQQERKSAAVCFPPHHASPCPRLGTLCTGPDDATRRCYDLDMQVRCGDGIRPVPANLRDPQTAGGLRADTRVLERRLIPKPLSLGQVRGVIEHCGIMRRTNRRRPACGPRAIDAQFRYVLLLTIHAAR
ncbi:hypothetical protein EV714DRAFT_222421 [Schizophyllum commune]